MSKICILAQALEQRFLNWVAHSPWGCVNAESLGFVSVTLVQNFVFFCEVFLLTSWLCSELSVFFYLLFFSWHANINIAHILTSFAL